MTAADLDWSIIERARVIAEEEIGGQPPRCTGPQADRYNAAFNAVVKALTPSACIAPDRPRLIERKLDDECGCPEELWEAFGAHLQMHLAAGTPSNAHADYGDEGEAEMEVTAATHDLARAAIFGWARELERPGAARGAPTGAVKAHA